MKIDHTEIMLSFWQQGTNNCASIALIKAAIEVFGIHKVFEVNLLDGLYSVKLKNGLEVSFTTLELQDSIRVANFQKSKDTTADKQAIYNELIEYGRLCYAVMVATYASIELKKKEFSFAVALSRLNNGANSNFIDKYLGLEDYTSNGRGDLTGPGIYAWFSRHTVYVSHGYYDYYGDVRKYRWVRYPNLRRINANSQRNLKALVAEPTFSELNYINISRFGTFHETGLSHTTPEEVDNILLNIKASGKKNLLLYFHGGLINEQRGIDGAKTFFDNYSGSPDTHVVSIVWETGLTEAIPQTLTRVLSDSLTLKLLHKVARFLGIKFGIVNPNLKFSKNEGPESVMNYALLFENTGMVDKSLSDLFSEPLYSENLATEGDIHQDMEMYLEDEELNEDELEKLGLAGNRKGGFPSLKILFFAAKIAYRCISRFNRKRDHGIWPTIVEEVLREVNLNDFGSEVWETMKTQAKNMWLSNDGRSGINQFAGRYLSEKIKEIFPENDLQIDVVGHSAGTIAICEWIRAINEEKELQSLRFRSAIFLTPACRCDLFHSTVLKYPDSIERFRMFTLSDLYESKDEIVPLLYPRSLLYLISGILEGEDSDRGEAYILGLARHISVLAPYNNEQILRDINNFLFANDNYRLIYSISSNGMGRSADASSHKNFTFSQGVMENVKHFLAEYSEQIGEKYLDGNLETTA